MALLDCCLKQLPVEDCSEQSLTTIHEDIAMAFERRKVNSKIFLLAEVKKLIKNREQVHESARAAASIRRARKEIPLVRCISSSTY